MTYNQRIKVICEECGQPETCGYYFTDSRRMCNYLENIMLGWKLGQQDTLDEVEDYIDIGNSTFTEGFMKGLKQHLEK